MLLLACCSTGYCRSTTRTPQERRACLPEESLTLILVPEPATTFSSKPSAASDEPTATQSCHHHCQGLISAECSCSVPCWVPGLLISHHPSTLYHAQHSHQPPPQPQGPFAATPTRAARVKSSMKPLLLSPNPTGTTHCPETMTAQKLPATSSLREGHPGCVPTCSWQPCCFPELCMSQGMCEHKYTAFFQSKYTPRLTLSFRLNTYAPKAAFLHHHSLHHKLCQI